MELVYLWVEDYKNIQKQGFNFSPRFECSYNDGVLDICDKKKKECKNNNYIENFFGENINVTAIVGENGSGKSNILRLLHRFFSEWIPNKIFIIFYHNEQLYLHSAKSIPITENKNNFKKIKFLTNKIKYNIFRNIHEIYYKNENNHKFLSNKDNQEFNLSSNNSSHIVKHFLKVLISLNQKKFSNVMFNPEYIEIDIEYDKLSEDLGEYKISTRNEIKKIIDNIENNNLSKKETLKQIFKILDLKSNMNNIGRDVNTNNIDDIETIMLNNQNDFHLKFSLNQKYQYQEYLVHDLNNVNFLLSQDSDNNHFLTLRIDKIEKNTIEFIYNLPSIAFNIKIFDENNVNFDSLSFGEKNLLSMLSMFISLSEQKTYEEYGTELIDIGDSEVDEVEMDIAYNEKINQNFFLIDEYELGLHPQWHKEMLKKMISFFIKLNKNIHLIITTHSPFILSDIPKENIIFLEKDNNGNCKNSSKEVDINPFGANIHTLLSHGFFMKDGLMGEFAKEKINKTITYLNKKELSKEELDYCEDIISIIGEPIIKNQLQKMLYSKRLSKIDEIDKLKDEMELIKHRIEILRKNK